MTQNKTIKSFAVECQYISNEQLKREPIFFDIRLVIFANTWLRKDDWMTGRVLRTWLFTTDRQMYGVGQIISAIEVTLCLLQHDNLTILSVAARLSYWEPGYIIKYRKWKRDHPVDETFCCQSCIERLAAWYSQWAADYIKAKLTKTLIKSSNMKVTIML